MELKITPEWLLSFGDDDYEPSGLITPNDRAELARRKAERLQSMPEGAERLGKDEPEDARPYSLLLAQK